MKKQFAIFFVAAAALAAAPAEPGLLFYLSGDHGFDADYAAGDPKPNFLKDVKVIPGGAKGSAFECANTQLMAYWAAGNVYAERGTLAFSWRSRYPVGPTPFPVFRVGYADHSSWDMVWLRIDYNGRGGFDAFVTDINLSRIRVSYVMPKFPRPDEWVHLAFSWDETRGVRLYVNGALAAEKKAQAVLYAGLDQFGPHSRIIAPVNVQSSYNFIRGGDIDEIRIYDRMLSDANIASLAKGVAPASVPPLARDLARPEWRDEWWLRYGWNRKGDTPPYLAAAQTRVRKVEIQDVYDLKRWWWKGTDGIRETTWPGVYNRSRLPGRNDYFQLPDWDCYSLSGKSVTFTMPDEPWNHLEISGSAWGSMYSGDKVLFQRAKGQEKTFHRLAETRGGKIRFENVEQEEPIGELSAYDVGAGAEPQGSARLAYRLSVAADDPGVEPLRRFIAGRFTEDERATVVAVPEGSAATGAGKAARGLPVVHVLIPPQAWRTIDGGLDGIALDLPALAVKPTHGALFALNVQVKDPIWPQRNMLDFSFSVKPGEARTLWLDTRDRILPEGKPLYLTIAGAGADFSAASLEGAKLRLVFKPRSEALAEHVADRFSQIRDNYANLVEEHANNPKLNVYNRFAGDVADLLRVKPDHWLTQVYWYDIDRRHPKPKFEQPRAPEGVPLWAFRQVEALRYLRDFVLWYIDHRQIENGELGGGLSDDGDLTNWWPGTAFMGAAPDKIKESLARESDAFYAQHMFTNGLSTIQADELHSYEEGIQALSQCLLLDYGSPKHLERAMETSRALIGLTGVNEAGHRHIRSSYFNGLKMATEEPWGGQKPYSFLVFHPALMLVEFNGNPQMKKLILELADGVLAHRKKGAEGKYTTFGDIRYQSDQDLETGLGRIWPVLWAAWRWTGGEKYLEPIRDEGPAELDLLTGDALDMLHLRDTWGKQIAARVKPETRNDGMRHIAWQMTGDDRYLEALYANQIEASALREYINTEGSLWIDRVMVANSELQRARLGGVALIRNSFYPGHAVSWRFQAPATDQSAAIRIPSATPERIRIEVYNLERTPVKAAMTGWQIEPGKWEIAQQGAGSRTVDLERTREVEFEFAPRTLTVLELKLAEKGAPYWSRPDLGISREDVVLKGNRVSVKVHSLGSADAPAATVAVVDAAGKRLAAAEVPALKAPLDLQPKTATVEVSLPGGAHAAAVVIDPDNKMREITRMNNRVGL